ncbi:MAG: hypothetical protein ACXW61_01870 [Gemmatirosa sp.]
MLDAIGMAIRVGLVGGIAGGVFAAFIRLAHRGRQLSEINGLRFGLGGAIVAELFMLAFFAITNLASGDGSPPLADILSDLIVAAVFGGIAAGASMWLATRATIVRRRWRDTVSSADERDVRRCTRPRGGTYSAMHVAGVPQTSGTPATLRADRPASRAHELLVRDPVRLVRVRAPRATSPSDT